MRRRRRSLRLRQADVGESIGVTQQTIGRWENGDPIDSRYWDKVGEFLDIDETLIHLASDPVQRALVSKETGRDPIEDLAEQAEAAIRGEQPEGADDSAGRPLVERVTALEEALAGLVEMMDRLDRQLGGVRGGE